MITESELKAAANKEVDTPDASWVSVLYGDYGSRKTTLACSMVNERGLLLSSDDSWKVLLNELHRELRGKIKIVPLEGLSQLDYVDFDGFDTIIWDTVSQSVDEFLDLLYDEANWGGKYREQLKTSHPELKKLQIEALAPADYRVTRDTLRPIFDRMFKKTNAHLIFTSQMVKPIPGLSANQQARPSIPEATFKILGTRADIIGMTTVAGNKAFIDVTQSAVQLGKSRLETVQGRLDLDVFVNRYKEKVFK
jgi:hypothetical protein